MALVATQEYTMDPPRHHHHQQQRQQNQPHADHGVPPSPVWTPSPTAPPFYPQFSPYFTPTGQPANFYDPNFAQWAYHQMLQQPPSPRHQPTPLTPQQLQQLQQHAQQAQQQYQGFHPYRRPPYGQRSEASGSATSLSSSSHNKPSPSPQSSVRQQRPNRGSPPSTRTPSTASSSSSTSSPRQSTAPQPSSPRNQPTPRPPKPSPLSQGQPITSIAEKRLSKDDSDLTPDLSSRQSGLKGRLRRALSFNPVATVGEETALPERSATPIPMTATTSTKPRSRAASLFNPRFNRSTDNISLSSTVSSASVMIRKLGTMGKLARRNTLASITGLFKDKDKSKNREGEEATSDAAAAAKSGVAEASVSYATVEIEPGSEDMAGLSPAAKLARQHTLRSNAAEAAAARAQAAAASGRGGSIGESPRAPSRRDIFQNGRSGDVEEELSDEEEDDDGELGGGPEVEDFHHQQQVQAHRFQFPHDEEDEDEEDDEDLTIRMGHATVEDDDAAWGAGFRRSLERTLKPAKGILKNAGLYNQEALLESMLPNPAFARPRSNSYGSAHVEPGPLARIPSPDPDHIDGLHHRTPSSSSFEHGSAAAIAMAHPRFSFEFGNTFTLPTLTNSPSPSPPPEEEVQAQNGQNTSVQASTSVSANNSPRLTPGEKTLFSHPNLNSSAPVLSTAFLSANGPGGAPHLLAHRAATTPVKRISFAQNLAVYDTFPSTVYDRRSEPATCNRLTPQLAQRIKEELNSYKMEEMEVHVASRIHTHFFV